MDDTKRPLLDEYVEPRIILHGGAGNITRDNLPSGRYASFRSSLLSVLRASNELLSSSSATALDVAVHAVHLLEDDPLFNCGRGSVFTRAGTNELEASVMVSRGYRKRGVACSLISHVKNPILLAKEMLVKGEEENGGGAQGHSHLSGPMAEELAKEWGLEMCDTGYYWTRRRWEEHLRGLERETGQKVGKDESSPAAADLHEDEPGCDGVEYLPQGTVGAVVLDRFGTICVATSTGGMTNKLPGRIGDTPTLGSGFWAEEWEDEPAQVPVPQVTGNTHPSASHHSIDFPSLRSTITNLAPEPFRSCLPILSLPGTGPLQEISHQPSTACYSPFPKTEYQEQRVPPTHPRRAIAISGTGNGDSFLRVCAAHSVFAICRYRTDTSGPVFRSTSLAKGMREVVGPNGALQRSAGDRWGTGEGEGGMIGIEWVEGRLGKVVWELNCGGMFRAWVDEQGQERFAAFKGEDESLVHQGYS